MHGGVKVKPIILVVLGMLMLPSLALYNLPPGETATHSPVLLIAGKKPPVRRTHRTHTSRPAFVPPPATPSPTAFPGLSRSRAKTSVQGGGGLRRRWKDQKGNIYEWDSRHGTLEKYDRNGNHLGEYDATSGEQLKAGDPSRSVEP